MFGCQCRFFVSLSLSLSFPQSFAHSFIPSLYPSSLSSVVLSFSHSFALSLFWSFVRSLCRSVLSSLTHSLALSLFHLSIASSFLHSFSPSLQPAPLSLHQPIKDVRGAWLVGLRELVRDRKGKTKNHQEREKE